MNYSQPQLRNNMAVNHDDRVQMSRRSRIPLVDELDLRVVEQSPSNF